MSGLWAGHSITATSSSERNVLTDFAMWHGMLSCVNIAGWLIVLLKLGSTCFFNISLYTVALILPCRIRRGPVPAADIMPNTTTLPPPNLMLVLVQCRSLVLHWTNLLSSLPKSLNFDSWLKWTKSHCSSVYMLCSVANFTRLILFFLEM